MATKTESEAREALEAEARRADRVAGRTPPVDPPVDAKAVAEKEAADRAIAEKPEAERRIADLNEKKVRSSDEHAELALLNAKVAAANAAGAPSTPRLETQAEKEIREDRENKEAAERAEVCARISSMKAAGWHGLREVLRQHGFGSLFNLATARERDVPGPDGVHPQFGTTETRLERDLRLSREEAEARRQRRA